MTLGLFEFKVLACICMDFKTVYCHKSRSCYPQLGFFLACFFHNQPLKKSSIDCSLGGAIQSTFAYPLVKKTTAKFLLFFASNIKILTHETENQHHWSRGSTEVQQRHQIQTFFPQYLSPLVKSNQHHSFCLNQSATSIDL